MKYQDYSEFKEGVLNHLGDMNPKPWGVFSGNGKTYPHIAYIPSDKTQEDVIKSILIKDRVEPDLFSKPHRYAHHLNSSQVACYEFFRPMIGSDRIILPKLVNALTAMGIPGQKYIGARADFEWTPYPEENTNFDFYIIQEQSDAKIYFEIKYTEQGFGCCPNDERHQAKFENIYQDIISNCACLSRIPDFDEDWRKNYQLFRNVLRVTKDNWENEYMIFLFPKENHIAKRQFVSFKEKYIKDEFKNHVKGIFWEQMTDFMSEKFREKFFFYTLV